VSKPVITAKDLSIEYRIGRQWLPAARNVELSIDPLQIHRLIGESGSGKSTVAMALIHYLARNARISDGQIFFGEQDLRRVGDKEIENIWGNQISLVPQNTMDLLNPSLRILKQMTEVTKRHLGLTGADAYERATKALRQVQIADPEQVLSRYPHQLSGGMVQRVMIAMALSTRPRLVVLDEPTTALDVTTQAVILDLLRDLIKEEEAAALYVSHDLVTVAQLCDFVTVLYAGEVMESAPVDEIFAGPRHPYTAGLLACLPSSAGGSDSRLTKIDGVAHALDARSSACVFADRCPLATVTCRTEKPPLEDTGDGRAVRCRRWQEIAAGELTPFAGSTEDDRGGAEPSLSLLLSVSNMSKEFGDVSMLDRLTRRRPGRVQALEDVSIAVNTGSTFGIVGESGSGKTTSARSILTLVEADEGTLELRGESISLDLAKRDRGILWNLRTVFQNRDDSLNPYRKVGQAIGRMIRKLSSEKLSPAAVRTRVEELLVAVGLTRDYYDRRPPFLSCGEKQRVAIARAFAPNPALVIADEPTSSPDVSV